MLRLTASKAGATVEIKAFDNDDGTALTVQDIDADRLLTSPTVTLGAANSIARYAIVGATGSHALTVEHTEHVNGVRAVTALMARTAGGTTQVVHPDVVEHCS